MVNSSVFLVKRFLLLMLCFFCFWTDYCRADITFLADRANPIVRLRVGSGSGISVINFDVPGSGVGSGVPVEGDSSVRVVMTSRFSSPQAMSITVDSSAGLIDGSNSIPVSEVSWTSTDGDVPASNFSGSTNQSVFTFTSSQRLRDRLTFSYANSTVVPAGEYSGRVIYTVVLP